MSNVFAISDIVYTIAKNLDFLSLKDRIALDSAIDIMLKDQNYPSKDIEEIKTKVFSDWAWYNNTVYDSIVLKGDFSMVILDTVRFTYEFSVMYPKDGTKPTIKENLLKQLIEKADLNRNNTFGLNMIVQDGIIWKLSGIAGKILFAETNETKMDIYCHDREIYKISFIRNTMHKRRYHMGKIFRETWYKNGIMSREGDLPTTTIIDTVTGNKDTELWYIDGKKGRINDLPAHLEYKTDDTYTSQISRSIWYKNGEYIREIPKI